MYSDADRDGSFYIVDLVGAKKIAAEITTSGNIIAVSRDNYEVDGLDIASLRINLLM